MIDWFKADGDDFWHHVDSAESPRSTFVCSCPNPTVAHEGDCGINGPGWMQVRSAIGCMSMRSDHTRCRNAPVHDSPFCELHLEKLAKWVGNRHPEAFARMLGHAEREYVDNVIHAHQVADLDVEVSALKSRVYFFGIDGRIVKIGRSVRPETRLLQVRQGSSIMPAGFDRKRVELLGSIPGNARLESKLHKVLQPHRLVGEWFTQSPDVIAVMAYLLGGEMHREAHRVFVDSLTRRWWVDEGYMTEDEAVAAMDAAA